MHHLVNLSYHDVVEAEEEPRLVAFQSPFDYIISRVYGFQDMFPSECFLPLLLLTSMLSI